MYTQLSNEFQFSIASFHHAGETYLVPDLLKKTYVRYTKFLDHILLAPDMLMMCIGWCPGNITLCLELQVWEHTSVFTARSIAEDWNYRKKREAYRGSEFAPRVLAAHAVPVVMKVCQVFMFADASDDKVPVRPSGREQQIPDERGQSRALLRPQPCACTRVRDIHARACCGARAPRWDYSRRSCDVPQLP